MNNVQGGMPFILRAHKYTRIWGKGGVFREEHTHLMRERAKMGTENTTVLVANCFLGDFPPQVGSFFVMLDI